ncbi:hypothetical protein LPJ64_004646 [Coemansia asiatica]|uniref:histidine--tRNA ligase n=1 Tax=Coemansia asiatica TaxID=1052880 RepID=A0A9W7XII4_9FUNG|nr:hypothetical protein LPJ64_004646 [Coemansia asiatica]
MGLIRSSLRLTKNIFQRTHYSTQNQQQQQPRLVRGMSDRIGHQAYKYEHIVTKAQSTMVRYGFEPISTPILEYSSVFERSLGTDSDVVGKELYKFLDSSHQWMTMRPEGTAAVARAVISNNLDSKLPLKLFYSGPMFRHERPQKGRLRQFEQFGVELIGVSHPAADIECVDSAWCFIRSLQIDGKMEVNLNTLGDAESRIAYRRALRDYFLQHESKLSPDSQRRLLSNPLRILDSKDEADIQVTHDAPIYTDYLSSSSLWHFDFVKRGIEDLCIPFVLNNKLVRGLDYYQHTVWEITCSSDLLGRSQATILAGGRYDGLTSVLGGPKSLPGIGWAAGIDRLAMLLADSHVLLPTQPIPVLIIPDRTADSKRIVNDELYRYANNVASRIRKISKCGAIVFHGVDNSTNHPQLGKQLTNILSKPNPPHKVVIVGSNEMIQKTVVIRDTTSQTQHAVGIEDCERYIE